MYLIGMFTLQAMHPETGPPHRLACPCHRLRLGHVMNSLCVRADRMYSFSERPMTWTVWAQASFGREKPDMSAEDDVHSSDIEEEAAAAGGRGRDHPDLGGAAGTSPAGFGERAGCGEGTEGPASAEWHRPSRRECRRL